MSAVVGHIDQMVQVFVDFGRSTNMKHEPFKRPGHEEESEEDGEEEEDEGE